MNKNISNFLYAQNNYRFFKIPLKNKIEKQRKYFTTKCVVKICDLSTRNILKILYENKVGQNYK